MKPSLFNTEKQRQVFIHIGHGKTGTTAVQDMFWLNRNDFLKAGVLYPRTGVSDGAHGLLQSAHHLLCNDLSEPYTELQEDSLRRTLASLLVEIDSSSAESVFISTELLCYSDPAVPRLMKEFFTNFIVRIIYVVRRQDYLIYAAYLQAAKEGRPDAKYSFEKYVELYGYAFNFMDRIDPWRQAFGSKSIDCILLEEGNNNDIRSIILELISCKIDVEKQNQGRTNASLSSGFLNFYNTINSLGISACQRWAIIEALERVPGITASKSPVSNDFINLCRTRFMQSNLEFAREFLDEEQFKYICFDLQ